MKPDPYQPLDDYEADLMELEAAGSLKPRPLTPAERLALESAARRTLTKD